MSTCVAVCWSVAELANGFRRHCRVLQGVAGCCRVLQGVAWCCRVLQSVAGCCRVLQGVAVWCSATDLDESLLQASQLASISTTLGANSLGLQVILVVCVCVSVRVCVCVVCVDACVHLRGLCSSAAVWILCMCTHASVTVWMCACIWWVCGGGIGSVGNIVSRSLDAIRFGIESFMCCQQKL